MVHVLLGLRHWEGKANALSNVVHHGMIYVPPGYLYGEKEAGAHLLPASVSPC